MDFEILNISNPLKLISIRLYPVILIIINITINLIINLIVNLTVNLIINLVYIEQLF